MGSSGDGLCLPPTTTAAIGRPPLRSRATEVFRPPRRQERSAAGTAAALPSPLGGRGERLNDCSGCEVPKWQRQIRTADQALLQSGCWPFTLDARASGLAQIG